MRHRLTTTGIAGGQRVGQAAIAWPEWAASQLANAIACAQEHAASDRTTALAGELYTSWFAPPVVETPAALLRRPLVGLYRQAHAGTSRRVNDNGLQIIDRRDVIGRDRWWRTWGAEWSLASRRARGVRILFSPDMDSLGEFVATATAVLVESDVPWLLACPTLPSRLRHSGSAVLYLGEADALPSGLLPALEPVLRNDTPPLCLPLAPGAALAEQPTNGMTFGEHRCHLVALALGDLPGVEPLRAIADVFGSHGVDPAHPHLGG